MKEDLGIEWVWDDHCGEENMEKEDQQESVCTKSHANYVAKILTDVLPYFQDIHIQGEKAKSSEQIYLCEHLQEKCSLLPTP